MKADDEFWTVYKIPEMPAHNPFIGEWNDDAEEYDPVPVSQLWDVHEEIERVMRDK